MRDGIDEFGETAPDQADLIAIEEAREAWALTRSHGASDDPLSPPTPQNWGIHGVLQRAWDVAAGIWGSNPALICPYDDSGPSVRLVGCLNARVGCCYHEMLFLPDFLKTAIHGISQKFLQGPSPSETRTVGPIRVSGGRSFRPLRTVPFDPFKFENCLSR